MVRVVVVLLWLWLLLLLPLLLPMLLCLWLVRKGLRLEGLELWLPQRLMGSRRWSITLRATVSHCGRGSRSQWHTLSSQLRSTW